MIEIKGIVFDKDGTLIDFMASWMPAIYQAANHFASNDQAIAAKMLVASGYDAQNHLILAGSILAAGNNQQIINCWSQVLAIQPDQDMLIKLDEIFQYHNRHSSVAVTDLQPLFSALRSRGIKIGLATSDSEQGARKTLDALGVANSIDFICGYDSGYGVKPEAGMVNAFCEKLQLDPRNVMVVGDNTHDLHMARKAQAKLAVGVLTGTSRAVKLYEADYILDSVADIPELLDNLQLTPQPH